MRKSAALCLVVAGFFASLILSGCGGGSGIAAARDGILSVTANAVAGPAGGPAGFSVSWRGAGEEEVPRTTARYVGRLLVNGSTVAWTPTLNIDAGQNQVSFSAMASVIPGPVEFALDIRPASSTAATGSLLKGCFRITVPDGAMGSASVTLDASSTARAMAYDLWKKRTGAAQKTIDDFTGDVSVLAGLVQTQLNADLASATPPTASFTWSSAVALEASRVADLTPIPGQETSAGPDLATGDLELSYNWEWRLTTAPDNVPSSPGEVIGLSYFKLPTTGKSTLGNYFAHIHPTGTTADQTDIIAWIPAATSLDDVATAPTSFGTEALARFPLPTELEVGQVYGFLVGGRYGALQITSFYSMTGITFRYKYNRRAGDPTLR